MSLKKRGYTISKNTEKKTENKTMREEKATYHALTILILGKQLKNKVKFIMRAKKF